MNWIQISEKMPEKGQKVKILCSLVTEGVYDPSNGVNWYQYPDAPSQAEITHWAEIVEEISG